jgi:protease-4
MRRLRRTLAALLAAVLLVLLLAVTGAALRLDLGWPAVAALAAAAALLYAAVDRLARRVPRRTILEVDLRSGVRERAADGPLARRASGRRPALRDVADALRRAASDRRVAALVARVGPGGMGPAAAEEIRAAVHAFRASGKRAVAHADSLGEGSNGTVGVWLASAFDQVWLQPQGDVALVGLHGRTPFLRGLLDRLGVVPRLAHRKEFKSAMYLFTERSMPAPQRAETERLLGSLLDEMVAGIAADRRLDEAEVRALVERGPLLGHEAVAARLVDGLKHRDEVLDRLEREVRGRRLALGRYLERAGRPERRGAAIALVHGTGLIETGHSRFRLWPPGPSMGADDLTEALRAARRKKGVRAVLFRIDSPGGSAVASEAIRREVELCGQAGKPVVAVMGNVAASGGYWVAMSAAKIVARATTLTGSIGVVGGKLVTGQAWERAGIRWDGVERGDHAGMWSADRDFSDAEWGRVQAWLDHVYQEFTGAVAAARGLAPEAVEALAGGRVWTGREAHARGLVDAIGGWAEAVALARELAGIAPGKPVRIVEPARRRRLARLLGRDEAGEELAAATGAAAAVLADVVAAAAAPPPPGPVRLDLVEPFG